MIVDRHTRPKRVPEVQPAKRIGWGVGLAIATVIAAVLVYVAASSILGVALVLATAIALAGTALLWNEPGWLLPLAMYVIWFEALPPGPVSSGRAVAFLAVAIPTARVLTSSWRPPAVEARVWLPSALLLLWALVSLLWNDSVGSWATGFFSLFLGFAYMLLFAIFIQSPEQLLRLFRPFIITGVVIGLLSAIVHYGLGYRSFGFTGGPNEYGALNVEAIPVCVILAARAKGWWRWFYYLAIPVFFIATLAAGSRSALIAMFGMVFFCCCCRPKMSLGQRAVWAVGALVTGVAGFLLAGILDPTRFSLAGFVSDRGAGRLDIWTAALVGLKDHWLLGYGIGGFEKHALALIQRATGASLDVARQADFKNGNSVPAHNLFLSVVMDLGVIGIVLYFGTMIVAIKNLVDMLKTEWRDLAWIGLGVMVVVIVAGPFASALNPKLQWAFTGLPGAYYVRRTLTDRSRRKSLHLSGPVDGHH